MKWDDAVRALIATWDADAELTTALGGQHTYRSGAFREPRVPSVEYFVVSTILTENTERVRLQVDIWATSYAQVVAIERRLRELVHRDLPHTLGGVLMWTQVIDSRDVPDPQPRVVHRSIDVMLEPARER
jgi:hypothetical protein